MKFRQNVNFIWKSESLITNVYNQLRNQFNI